MRLLSILSVASLLFVASACTPETPVPSTPETEDPEPEVKPKPEVKTSGILHLIGDSLCCIWAESARPKTGWGECLAAKLGGNAVVNNYALSGRSSKSFIDKGDWDKAVANVKEGDLMLIQFGANDGNTSDATRYAEPYGAFTDNLKRFVRETRAKGGIPVLITEPNAHVYGSDGQLKRSWGQYPEATRKVASLTNVVLIDANELTYQGLRKLGEDASAKYYMVSVDGSDNTHFTREGAEWVAALIAEELKAQGLWK